MELRARDLDKKINEKEAEPQSFSLLCHTALHVSRGSAGTGFPGPSNCLG